MIEATHTIREDPKWRWQNLKIKAFIERTDNPVMTEVFVALCVYRKSRHA